MATITFERKASGSSAVGGYVVETLTSNSALLGEKNRDIVAGIGTIEVAMSGRRHLLPSLLQPLPPVAPARRPRWLSSCDWCDTLRCRAQSSNYVYGDITKDCGFTLSDLARQNFAKTLL